MKAANVTLGWTRSVSTDLAKVVITVDIGGNQTVQELSPEVTEFKVQIKANTAFSFRIDVTDTESNTTSSETYSYTLGDLEAPQPATGLFHRIDSVVDVPDSTGDGTV